METKETQGCCCGGNKDRFAKVDEILAHYNGVKGALIPVLQEAQGAYGFLPKDIISRIAQTSRFLSARFTALLRFTRSFT